ncbi:transcriptional regulator [Micromonospora sp. CA-263727]|uniref:transcriptional regulator n=1 Tax=Micromonospora sp. CA-263727 TaxID=3239967 RepID=UPI003D8D042E
MSRHLAGRPTLQHRWPSAERRAALRRVLGAATDSGIGLYSPRRTGAPTPVDHNREALDGSRSDLLPIGDLFDQEMPTIGRRIGRSAISELAARVHRLRLADDVLAGGDLVGPAYRELRAAAKLYRESSHTESVGRGLLVQFGELAQIAGWIASDAGLSELAERTYQLGASAARQAGDRSLAANLIGSLAYQHSNTGREREAVHLAQAAVDEAGLEAPAETRALFLDRLAWTYARANEPQSALRSLGEAHDALLAGDGEAPQWAYWVNQDELNVMDARVLTEIHRPREALPLLSKALDGYDATHAREVALYLSWLVAAYVDADEPEAAAHAASRMLDLARGLPSARATERVHLVMTKMAPFRKIPSVYALLTERREPGSPAE